MSNLSSKATVRQEVLIKIAANGNIPFERSTNGSTNYFGINTFNEHVMRERLPKDAYKKLRDTIASLETLTVMGRFGVDATGQQIRHFALVTQWQNGNLEVVGPADMEGIKSVAPIFK